MLLEVITISIFKKKQVCQSDIYITDTDILVEQLKQVQTDIKKLEEEKANFDAPRFLNHEKAKDLCRMLYCIFNARCSADALITIERLERRQDQVEYLKYFGNFLLALAGCSDEYNRIKNELSNKRIEEQSLKKKIGIK